MEYISFSQVNTYLRCPKQFYFRYVKGIISPPGCALLLGSSWHKAIEHNYKNKIKQGKLLELEEVKSIFVDNYDNMLKDNEYIFDKEKNETPDKIKDLGVSITELHHKEIAQTVQPQAVEQEFALPLTENKALIGFIDLVDGTKSSHIIVDNKSYSKTPSNLDLQNNIQFSLYALAYRLDTNKQEAGLRMDCVIKTKKPKAVQLNLIRDNQDLIWALEIVKEVNKGIEAGIFPANPNGWHCSKKQCGYYKLCRKK